jgi:hypothetical protein
MKKRHPSLSSIIYSRLSFISLSINITGMLYILLASPSQGPWEGEEHGENR